MRKLVFIIPYDMKRISTMLLCSALALCILLQTSCYGKFNVTRKLYQWNGTLGDKFVNSIVMCLLGFTQVYTIVAAADFLLFNLIEFWTGSNPVTMKEGEVQKQLVQAHGNQYQITATKNKLSVEQISGTQAGRKVSLEYDPQERTWNANAGGKTVELLSVSNDNSVYVPATGGSYAASDFGLRQLKADLLTV